MVPVLVAGGVVLGIAGTAIAIMASGSSADAGDASAMLRVAEAFGSGDGTEVNPEAARRWLDRAAAAGAAPSSSRRSSCRVARLIVPIARSRLSPNVASTCSLATTPLSTRSFASSPSTGV